MTTAQYTMTLDGLNLAWKAISLAQDSGDVKTSYIVYSIIFWGVKGWDERWLAEEPCIGIGCLSSQW
eukprot:1930679-Amphidinium_carterae.2